MEHKKAELYTIVVRLIAVMLLLVLLTSGLVSGHYARYTTYGDSIDNARAAKYQIDVSSAAEDSLTLSSESPAVYTLSVTSSSEVAVEYDLSVDFPDYFPDGIAIELKCGDKTTQMVRNNTQYFAKNVGAFPAQGGTHTYTMKFIVTQPVGANVLSGVSVRVDARQVD